jgi:hypothetical protein
LQALALVASPRLGLRQTLKGMMGMTGPASNAVLMFLQLQEKLSTLSILV